MEHVRGCHFAVSWLLTWFAHGLDDVDDAARLFDVLLGSDPLMPLYVGAAAIVADRAALLALARGLPLPGETERDDDSPRDDWPVVEGMLHTRLSELPALVGREPRSRGKARREVRVRLRLDVEDGRANATLFVAGEGEGEGDDRRAEMYASREPTPRRTPEGWGVDAVVAAALELHQRIPPRSLFSVLGIEPDPFSAYAAYPYPWLRMHRRGFGSFGRGREGEGNDARASGGVDDEGDDIGGASSSRGTARKVGAGAGPSRRDDDGGFHFGGLGNGKSRRRCSRRDSGRTFDGGCRAG